MENVVKSQELELIVNRQENDNVVLKKEITEFRARIEALEVKVAEQGQIIAEQDQIIAELKVKVSVLEAENAELKVKVSVLESENTELKAENAELKIKVEKQGMFISSLQVENFEESTRCRDLERNLNNRSSKHSREMKNLRKEILILREKFNELKESFTYWKGNKNVLEVLQQELKTLQINEEARRKEAELKEEINQQRAEKNIKLVKISITAANGNYH